MKNRVTKFVPATYNYKITSGTYDFLICKMRNSEDSRGVQVKCKFLKTALRRIINKVDSQEEVIDYEVAVSDKKSTTFINLHALESKHFIHEYLG